MRLIQEADCRFVKSGAYNSSLRIYKLLTDTPQSFIDCGWSAEDILWSRYFWFSVFVKSKIEKVGFDAGLEQQAFKLLEASFPKCLPDWSMLEQVNFLVEQQAKIDAQ